MPRARPTSFSTSSATTAKALRATFRTVRGLIGYTECSGNGPETGEEGHQVVSRRQRLYGLTLVLLVVAFSTVAAPPPLTFARAAGSGGAYSPLAPSRIFDTRSGTGSLGPGQSIDVQVMGQGNVPSTASAVVLNVTATNTTAASYLTVYPTGAVQPVASNLNWVAGQTIPNLVEVGLGAGGKVTVYNAAGHVDVLFDVAGYVATGLPAGQGLYTPLVPTRILDTRDGTGGVAV